MKRFVEGEDRSQSVLFPERLDDYIGEDNPVRAIDAFVEELDLADFGFDGVHAEETGRPAYHPASMLRIYIYGYMNRPASRQYRDEPSCAGLQPNPGAKHLRNDATDEDDQGVKSRPLSF